MDKLPVGWPPNPELRKPYNGRTEFVVTFSVRRRGGKRAAPGLGFLAGEAIGHAELLDTSAAVDTGRPPAGPGPLLEVPAQQVTGRTGTRTRAGRGAGQHADPACEGALLTGRRHAELASPVRNATGRWDMLGSLVTRRTVPAGCAEHDRRPSPDPQGSPSAVHAARRHLAAHGDATDHVARACRRTDSSARPAAPSPRRTKLVQASAGVRGTAGELMSAAWRGAILGALRATSGWRRRRHA